jgi:hypothetical protein
LNRITRHVTIRSVHVGSNFNTLRPISLDYYCAPLFFFDFHIFSFFFLFLANFDTPVGHISSNLNLFLDIWCSLGRVFFSQYIQAYKSIYHRSKNAKSNSNKIQVQKRKPLMSNLILHKILNQSIWIFEELWEVYTTNSFHCFWPWDSHMNPSRASLQYLYY